MSWRPEGWDKIKAEMMRSIEPELSRLSFLRPQLDRIISDSIDGGADAMLEAQADDFAKVTSELIKFIEDGTITDINNKCPQCGCGIGVSHTCNLADIHASMKYIEHTDHADGTWLNVFGGSDG